MGNLVWGKMLRLIFLEPSKVIALEPSIKSQKVVAEQTHARQLAKKPAHEEEKIVFVLFLTGGFITWFMFL